MSRQFFGTDGIRGRTNQWPMTAELAMKVGMTIPIDEPDAMSLILNGRIVAEGRYGAHEGLKAMQFTQFKEHKS